MKHILVFGATGRTGNHLVSYALEKGHRVTCLVRNPEKMRQTHPQLTLVKGTPYELNDVRRAITGCDTVISVLNNSRKSDLPWAKLVAPPDVLERAAKNALTAMEENGIRRILVLSTVGAGDSARFSPLLMCWAVKYTNLGVVFADHTRTEQVLQASSSDWTAVRAAALTNGEKDKSVTAYYEKRPRLMISRKNTAKFMIDSIDASEYFQKMPMISH